MSKYRHWWRPTVERAIRQYPALKEMKRELQQPRITANVSGMPRSGNIGDPTGEAAMRELSPQEEATIDAVEAAAAMMAQCRDGKTVLQIVDMVDFKRRYTVQGAADALHLSLRAATDKRTRFIDAVGKKLGYM